MEFDAERARRLERLYAAPEVAATRAAVFAAVNPGPGDRVMDLGCGPGFLVHEFARAVGSDGLAAGIDLSEPMLERARVRLAEHDNVSLHHANATELPFEDGTFDALASMQVFAYIKDLAAALQEVRRVLRPDGRAVILDTDMSSIVFHSRHPERMARVVKAYDGHCVWPDIVRQLPGALHAAGFVIDRCEAHPFVSLRYHQNTFVYGISKVMARFAVEDGAIDQAEADAWQAEFAELERDRAFFFSMNRMIFQVRPR